MTIASLVYAVDGIAMATDSRFTLTQVKNDGTRQCSTVIDNAQKLFLVRSNTIGIAFRGKSTINGKSWSEVISSIEYLKTVKDISKKLLDEIKKEESMSEFDTTCYVAGYDYNRPYVYYVHKNGVEKINKSGNPFYAFMGEVFASKKLFEDVLLNKNLKIETALQIVEYIVDTEIKYQTLLMDYSFCGGSIDVLAITKDYTRFVKHKILNP